jgi:hypothetical protein
VGWRERDWARFTDEERRALYGGGSTGYLPPVAPPTARLSDGNRLRAVVWSLVVVATLGTGGFAYSHRQVQAPGHAPAPPRVIYGDRGTDTTVDPQAPGGTGTACTDESFDTAHGGWVCNSWELNVGALPVVRPQTFAGACTHVVADETSGRWTCVAPVGAAA